MSKPGELWRNIGNNLANIRQTLTNVCHVYSQFGEHFVFGAVKTAQLWYILMSPPPNTLEHESHKSNTSETLFRDLRMLSSRARHKNIVDLYY